MSCNNRPATNRLHEGPDSLSQDRAGRIFGKKAASYVDSDMVSEGRSHVYRYRVDHLNAMHQTFVTVHARSPAP